jgi:hypothetical protein
LIVVDSYAAPRRAAISDPPRDEPWGARTFSVHDPSGNTIFVMGPVAGTREPVV